MPLIHPLDPLSRDEIVQVANIIREQNPGIRFAFKACWLLEPPKVQLAPYLDAERAGSFPLPAKPDRKAEVLIHYLEKPHVGAEIFVNLTTRAAEGWHDLDPDQHLPCDFAEVDASEKALYNSQMFKDEIANFKLPNGAVVVADPWIYGADSPDPMRNLMHYLVYMRNAKTNDPNSNHYALPLPIVPVIDMQTMEVIRIDKVYTGDESDGMTFTYDPQTCTDHLQGNEYDPSLRNEPTRPIKPLHVTQPEGPSFEVSGYQIRWQEWCLRIGFNYREGLTLHDVSFKGRQTFYRLSLSDMTVPYGDPRPPLHRKQAFDLGDNGAGVTANSLILGCDCLGLIKYFDGYSITRDGTPVLQRNVICMHEQDNGLMWKHTHFRTNHAVAARSRILILQTILTVANYEYIIQWKFDQAGAIDLELGATGILSTQHIDANKTSPYGTVVSPGVLAAHHQHIFSVRVDPAIDGSKNTFVYDEVNAMAWSTPEEKQINPYGTGFVTERTVIDKEGWADARPQHSRVFKVINERNINPVSGKPVGYKFHVPPTQTMLAHPESTCFIRADFADHHVYATKYRDGQLYSGGKYTNQSRGTQDGLKSWIVDPESIRDEDLVLWFNFGLTHVARVEDFPVMPIETTTLTMKPADFFASNPAGDLPASVQSFNQSQQYEAAIHRQGNAEIEEKGSQQLKNRSSCCIESKL